MMQQLIERIKKGQFWRFPGGVKPSGFKAMSNQHEIERIPLAEKLYIPIKQHVGISGSLLHQPGERVLKGQRLTNSANPSAVPVHAPTSGNIIEIIDHVSCHPSGLPEKAIVMAPDGLEEWIDLVPVNDYHNMPRAELVEKICSAGISGMGGAGFPTHIKLSSDKNVEFLIINGVECEPYITSDDRLMREHAWQIRQGIDVLCHILQPQHVLIAIEDNKPEAYGAMEIAVQDNPQYILCSVETVYPAGGEKQLIQVLTGREVPSKQLPVDIGVMMHNVGTCFAVADAVFAGKPLIERVVTLAGDAIEHAQNLWLPLGTPVEHAVSHCGYQPQQQNSKRYIMGGPMMGFTLHSEQVPVIKTSNCILVPSDTELPPPGQEMACIRCGACADACPAGLLPQQLYWHAKGKEFDKAQQHNLFDCIECGACAYVCPSEIPLVHYYRSAKAEIRLQEEDAIKAVKAKERFEARNTRLERDKNEREEKARLREEARNTRPSAKTSNAQNSDASEKATSASDRVAAALARAKAKKAAQSQTENEQPQEIVDAKDAVDNHVEASVTPQDDKKAKVAAAIARAKAKKAALQNNHSDTPAVSEENVLSEEVDAKTSESESPVAQQAASPEDDKKAKIAAAIARAKAKKAALQKNHSNDANTTPEFEKHEKSEETEDSEKIAEFELSEEFEISDEQPLNEQEEQRLNNPSEDVPSEDAPSQEQAVLSNSSEPEVSPDNEENSPEDPSPARPEDDKKARIAAAVARAKAKKAAREQLSQEQHSDNNDS